MFDIVSRNRTLGEEKALRKLLKLYNVPDNGVGFIPCGDDESADSKIVYGCRRKLKRKLITCNTASWFAFIWLAKEGADVVMEEMTDEVPLPEMQDLMRGMSEFMGLLEEKSQSLLQSRGAFISQNTIRSMGVLAYGAAQVVAFNSKQREKMTAQVNEMLSDWSKTTFPHLGEDEKRVHLLDDDDISHALSVCERLSFDEELYKYGVEVW